MPRPDATHPARRGRRRRQPPTQPRLSPEYLRTVHRVFGSAGDRFAADLPRTLAACERRFAITVGAPYDLSYNYVCAATRREGTPVVLKLAPPQHAENTLAAEAEVLRQVDGRGAVRVLDEDHILGAILLEAAVPGARLTELVLAGHDGRATAVAADVMRGFRQAPPVGHGFPTLDDYAQAFGRHRDMYGSPGPLPGDALDAGERLYAELTASQAEPVLLHGDLHHDNILSGQRDPWLAIDPKGLIGEPAYEVGAFLRNPWQLLELPDPQRLVNRRVDQLVELLDLPVDRVRGWGYAVNVLSAVWDVDDPEDLDDGWRWPLTCAELVGRP